MIESFADYIDRVSRARHILMSIYKQHDFLHGVSVGYANSQELVDVIGAGSKNGLSDTISNLESYARRLSLKAKTLGLVSQDRVLTYREEELMPQAVPQK